MHSRFLGTMTWCKETMTEHIGGWVLEPLFGSILAQRPIQVPPPLCFAHPTHPWFVAEDGYPHMVTTGLVDLSWLCVAGVAFCMWVCFLHFQVFQTLQLCHHSIGKAFCSSGLVGRGSLCTVGFASDGPTTFSFWPFCKRCISKKRFFQQVIGMNTAIFSPSGASAGIGFAIPSDTVSARVNSILKPLGIADIACCFMLVPITLGRTTQKTKMSFHSMARRRIPKPVWEMVYCNIYSFQLRGLRQILKIPTTYIDRRWTNDKVFQPASRTAYPHDPNRRIRPVTTVTIDLDQKRVRLAGHILRAPNHDPLRQVSYQQNSAEPKHIGKRRVGRPRQHWVFKSNEDIHALHSHTQYDGDQSQNDAILRAAQIEQYNPKAKRPSILLDAETQYWMQD